MIKKLLFLGVFLPLVLSAEPLIKSNSDASGPSNRMLLSYNSDLEQSANKALKKNDDVKLELFNVLNRFKEQLVKVFLEAQFKLGQQYEKGDGVKIDYKKAVKIYESAANQGHIDSILRLGVIYHNGYLGKINYDKALNYYRQAAEANSVEGYDRLGFIYQVNFNNITEAIKNYELASAKGHAGASFRLASLYLYGNEVPLDEPLAIKYLERSSEQGNDTADLFLGYIYSGSYTSPVNKPKAIYYFEKAAAKGNEIAQFRAGLYYFEANDYYKARQFFERSAEGGESASELYLGVLYLEGKGVTQNYEMAKYYLERAANADESLAQVKLGLMYVDGKVSFYKDMQLHEEYFDDELSYNDVEDLELENGQEDYTNFIQFTNYQKAIEYFEQAAAQNEVTGIYNLGFMYANGLGVEVNYLKAAEYYELACKKGANIGCDALKILKKWNPVINSVYLPFWF